jgi:hypothetical protein
MTIREIVRQLSAAKACAPIHRYSTIHMRLEENPMMIAFVRRALGDQVDVQLASHRLFEVLHILKFLLTRDQDHRLLA